MCGYPAIYGSRGEVLNATAVLTKDGQGIVLSAAAPAGFVVTATSYGRESPSIPALIMTSSQGAADTSAAAAEH